MGRSSVKKEAPLKHKEDNLFRFESFNDRISKIKIGHVHHIQRQLIHQDDVDDSEQSHFSECLLKWFDFNCSDDFEHLKQSLGTVLKLRTLPQIILGKEELVGALKNELGKEDNKALEVVFELIAALAKDLKSDFCPYFDELFDILIQFRRNRDPKVLEDMFVCLTTLFKVLGRYLVSSIEEFMTKFASSLLGDGEPAHVRRFAAMSIAFLLRKVQDRRKLITHLFGLATEQPRLNNGLAQVFCQVITGIKRQLHSCAGVVLSDLIELRLSSEWITQTAIDDLLKQLMTNIAQEIDPQHSAIVWKTLFSSIANKETAATDSMAVQKVARLIETLLITGYGRFAADPEQVGNFLIKLLLLETLDEHANRLIAACASKLLLLTHRRLPVPCARTVISAMFDNQSHSDDLVIEFARSLASRYPMYDRDVLPKIALFLDTRLMHSYGSAEFNKFLSCLTSIVVQRCPVLPLDSDQAPTTLVFSVRSEPLIIDNEPVRTVSELLLRLATTKEEPIDLATVWCALRCIPTSRPILDRKKFCEELIALAIELNDRLIKETSSDAPSSQPVDKLLRMSFCEAITVLTVFNCEQLLKKVDLASITQLLKLYPADSAILNAVNNYLAFAKRLNRRDLLTNQILQEIFIIISTELSSPFSKTRSSVTQILSNFSPPDTMVASSAPTNQPLTSIFQLCFEAENIEPSMENYRARQNLLSKMDAIYVDRLIPVDVTIAAAGNDNGSSYSSAPLRFLLGTLYVNFSLLWEPILKLVHTYLSSDEKSQWAKFLLIEHYKCTEERIQQLQSDGEEQQRWPMHSDSVVNEALKKFYDHSADRVDHYTHRTHLLRMIQEAPETFEPINRHIVALFMDFLNTEAQFIELLGKQNVENLTQNQPGTADGSMDASPLDEPPTKEPGPVAVAGRAKAWQTLIAFLKVFAKFKNPKALFREPELMELYLRLLSYPRVEVQEAVFDCICCYKQPYVTPYREGIRQLLDEKSFSTALVMFSLNPSVNEDKTVQEQHRPELMPLIMRILYGKMLTKDRTRASGKSGNDVRRDKIFRFIRGCSAQEINLFIGLALTPLRPFVDQPYPDMLTAIGQVTPERCPSLKKVYSSVKTLILMAHHLGNVNRTLLPCFFKYTLAACSFALQISRFKEQINQSHQAQLKSFRGECYKALLKFFRQFDDYAYTKVEIETLFEAIVMPNLDNLRTECVTSPTPLLRLFECWSENSRFFALLNHQTAQGQPVAPFDVVMDLFGNGKSHSSVISVITDIIEHLTTFDMQESMNEADDERRRFPSPSATAEDEPYPLNAVNGMDIIIPHIPKIIERYRQQFEETVKLKGKKIKIRQQDLTILSAISGHISSADEASALGKLLLELFAKSYTANNETSESFLSTISNLIERATPDQDPIFLTHIAPLLDSMTESHLRKRLCQTMEQVIAARSVQFAPTIRLVMLLNAYQTRYIEEPDYERRFEGFRGIGAALEQRTLNDVISLALIAHNCCHTLNTSRDSALKEAALGCLKKLIIALTEPLQPDGDDNQSRQQRMAFQRVCIDILLGKAIRRGLKDRNESVRQEFISLLVILLQYGKDKHSTLTQLATLSDEDVEQDFWINCKHIQSARRIKIFNKLTASKEKLSAISSDVLSGFVLSVPSSYIFDASNLKANFVTACIDLIGSVAHSLNWFHYESLLRHYLKLLSKERERLSPIVRVISSILSNFHFDLTPVADAASNVDIDQEQVQVPAAAADADPQLAEATKIFNSISLRLIPDLKRSLYEMSFTDYEHDSMKKEHPEDEQMQRIPIAIALVKLLRSLPASFKLLERNLPGILLRLCHFLKSRAESVRESARNSLLKVMQSLGHLYFPYLLKELQATLTRGYQLHILSYTVHHLLVHMRDDIPGGGIDCCLDDIVTICIKDLLGDVAEEKEVGKIVAKLKEARKSSKSLETFSLLASIVGEGSIVQLVTTLRNLLIEAKSHGVVRKLTACVNKVMFGLSDSKSLSEKTLLTFIYGIGNELLFSAKQENVARAEEQRRKKLLASKRKREDCLLIVQESPRDQKPVKSAPTTNVHILVEQSFLLLHVLLKRDRLDGQCDEHLSLLDPFIPLLTDYLASFKQSSGLVSAALRCLQYSMSNLSALPALADNSARIKNCLFVLIEDLSGSGGGGSREGDREQLLGLCFKTLSTLLRTADEASTQLSDQQLSVLLSYIDQDIAQDVPKTTTFGLLRAILQRRLQSAALEPLMAKVMQMTVLCEVDHIRTECHHCTVRYLMEYPHGKRLRGHVIFFSRQLEYEHRYGRQISLQVLHSLIKAFPAKILESMQALLFIPIASRLINEESAECKKLVSQCLEELVGRVSETNRDSIFKEILMPWLRRRHEDSTAGILQRRLALQLIAIVLKVDRHCVFKNLNVLMALLRQQLEPGNYAGPAAERAEPTSATGASSLDGEESSDEPVQATDHFIYQALSTLAQLMRLEAELKQRNTALVRSSPWAEHINAIWESVQAFYLRYPHAWVRLISAQLFALLFSHYTPAELAETVLAQRRRPGCSNGGDGDASGPGQREAAIGENDYLLVDTEQKLSGLCKTFLALVPSVYDVSGMGEQLVKNLAFIAKVIVRLRPDEQSPHQQEEEDQSDRIDEPPPAVEAADDQSKTALSMAFLLRKINKQISAEVGKDNAGRSLTERRMWSFKLLAAVAVEMSVESLRSFCIESMLMPLCRELNATDQQPGTEVNDIGRQQLVLLVQQVLDVIKSRIGEDEFGVCYAEAQLALRRKRMQRKKEKALQLVQNPEKGVKLRQKKHAKKRLALKRKFADGIGRPSSSAKRAKRAAAAALLQ